MNLHAFEIPLLKLQSHDRLLTHALYLKSALVDIRRTSLHPVNLSLTRGPNDHVNTRIPHAGSKTEKARLIPETMVLGRIFMLMWPVGSHSPPGPPQRRRGNERLLRVLGAWSLPLNLQD